MMPVQVQFFFKSLIKKVNEFDIEPTSILAKLGEVEKTHGVDLFYHLNSVVNSSSLSIFQNIPHLRELILYPLLDASEFIKGVATITYSSLQVLQLGMMNVSVGELIKIFT